MSRRATVWLAVTLGVAAVTTSSQSAGRIYFTAAGALANGGLTRDATYSLIGQVGGAPLSGRARGATHEVVAGFSATINPVVSGSAAAVWPMAVRPQFVDLDPASDVFLTLLGAELTNDGWPTITLGGRFAPVITPSRSSLLFTLDRLVIPGWQQLDMVTARGTTSLPYAVGVRPLLMLKEPAAPDRRVRLLLHARHGDTLMLAASWGLGPAQRIPPFHHVLRVNQALWIFLGGFTVTAADGRLALTLPSIGLTTGIHMQGLALNLGGPYDPGSFTNTLAL